MTIFWISATLMVGVALLFCVPGLLRGPRVSAKQLGRAAAGYRKQLKSLELAFADGHIKKPDYQSRRLEITDAIVASIEGSPEEASVDRSPGVGIALVFLLPVLTVFLYLNYGTPAALGDQIAGHGAALAVDPQQQAPELGQAIAGLIARLEQNRDDIDGWLLLGRSYMSMQNYQAATDALQHAHELEPNEPLIMADLAEAIAFSSAQRELPDNAVTLLEQALVIEPRLQKALWLLGLGNYQHGEYQKALGLWEQLLSQLEPGSGVASTVIEQINSARGQLGMELLAGAPTLAATPPAAIPSASPNTQATRSLTVEVSLAADLSDRISPNDTLFIFARAASGPKMPLAIQRLTAGQLPVTVILDDTMGMMPQMNLASFPEVVVGARISRSGDAMPHPGDLEALSDPVANNQEQPVRLEINSVL